MWIRKQRYMYLHDSNFSYRYISNKTTIFQSIILKSIHVRFYTDISCLGGVFAKNTSRETKNLKTGIFCK